MAEIRHDLPPLSKLMQCVRMLENLKEHGELSTTDCRDYLDICHPAGRVYDLKKQGYGIRTKMVWRADAEGRMHRQAVYQLVGGVQ